MLCFDLFLVLTRDALQVAPSCIFHSALTQSPYGHAMENIPL